MKESPDKEMPEADGSTKRRGDEPERPFDPDDLIPASGGEISSETVERMRQRLDGEDREAEGEQT
ncbi:hypothetical protein GQF42_42415 [Streptomyces broussonetiae]|uniref:DUF3072 domain-containing protein n=2 Tax=Streptomyces broussonetiae TaxID=2686304 RepID=A0A6I6NFR4_9ACTN|nr:hypothetical protein GQF42_42415 [Streptomyces broussonetiae]